MHNQARKCHCSEKGHTHLEDDSFIGPLWAGEDVDGDCSALYQEITIHMQAATQSTFRICLCVP